ncbi:MAG: hypothetical protein IKZ00_06530 [Bacteroidaceae bacterium]|nr:hypothetical protein [Bacteroidaceae bacterium]
MTKDKALQSFFERFMTAYSTASVPKDAVFPYMTYEYVADTWEAGEVGMTVNLWFYTDSESVPNAKVQEISDAIGMGGTTIKCDGGFVWIKRGSPWCQSLSYDTDPGIKRRYMNVTAEYMTLN